VNPAFLLVSCAVLAGACRYSEQNSGHPSSL
jgi:hypothetical protein